LEQAERDVAVLRDRVGALPFDAPAWLATGSVLPPAIFAARQGFVQSLADDLNTPSAVECLGLLATIKGDLAATTLRDLSNVVGLTLSDV
jgi:hypothetical protein